jgi:hypothetical protein
VTIADIAEVADISESQPDSNMALVGSQQVLAGQEKFMGPSTSGTVENTANNLLFKEIAAKPWYGTSGHLTIWRWPSGKTTLELSALSTTWRSFFCYNGITARPWPIPNGYSQAMRRYGENDHRTLRAAERVSIAWDCVHSPSQQMCDS